MLLDEIDLEHLNECIESRGYRIIAENIASTIEQQRGELEKELDATATARVRGLIAGLRLAVQIPTILKSEFKSRGR